MNESQQNNKINTINRNLSDLTRRFNSHLKEELTIPVPKTFSGTLINEDTLLLGSISVDNNTVKSVKITDCIGIATDSNVEDITIGNVMRAIKAIFQDWGNVFKKINNTLIDTSSVINDIIQLTSETEISNNTSNYPISISLKANPTTNKIDILAKIERTFIDIPFLTSSYSTSQNILNIGFNKGQIFDAVVGNELKIIDESAEVFNNIIEEVTRVYPEYLISFSSVPDSGTWEIQKITQVQNSPPYALAFNANANDVKVYLIDILGYSDEIIVTGSYLNGFQIVFTNELESPELSIKNALLEGGLAIIVTAEITTPAGVDVLLAEQINSDFTVNTLSYIDNEVTPAFIGTIDIKAVVEELTLPFTLFVMPEFALTAVEVSGKDELGKPITTYVLTITPSADVTYQWERRDYSTLTEQWSEWGDIEAANENVLSFYVAIPNIQQSAFRCKMTHGSHIAYSDEYEIRP